MKTIMLTYICAACGKVMSRKRVRMSEPVLSKTSHGICPVCGPKLYGAYWPAVKKID